MNRDRTVSLVLEKFLIYSQWTATTSVHKDAQTAILCCLLGMSGEMGEYIRHTEDGFVSVDESELLQKEIGDILWYIGHLAYRLGITQDIKIIPDEVDFGIYDNGFDSVSKIHEMFKKVIRDFDFDVDESGKKPEIIKQLSVLLTAVFNEVEQDEFSESDVDFISILETNMEKLESRKNRNKIRGDGDER